MKLVVCFLIVVFAITLGIFAGREVAYRAHPEEAAPEGAAEGSGYASVNAGYARAEARMPYVMWGAVGGGVLGLVACVVYDRKFSKSGKPG